MFAPKKQNCKIYEAKSIELKEETDKCTIIFGEFNRTSLVAQMVKCLSINVGVLGSIPGSGRFPGEGNGTPLQYSCLDNPMNGGAWCRLLSMGSQRVGHD